MISFMLRYWRYLSVAALVGVAWFHGYTQGASRVQRMHDAYVYQQSIATQIAQAKVAAHEDEQRKANQKVVYELQKKLTESDSFGRSLARRLRDYQAAAAASVPEATDLGQPPAASGSDFSTGQIEQAVADAFGACSRDAARLDALIEEVRRQL